MGHLFDSFDLIFALGNVAFFVLAVCAMFYNFYGEKLTLTDSNERREKANPGTRFWMTFGIILACALGVAILWMRR